MPAQTRAITTKQPAAPRDFSSLLSDSSEDTITVTIPVSAAQKIWMMCFVSKKRKGVVVEDAMRTIKEEVDRWLEEGEEVSFEEDVKAA